jgi:flagellar basal-body rod protein FlgB
MDLTKLALFEALNERMNWLGQRQRVLAENIANQNTPDYRPRDLDESEFARALRRTSGRLGLASADGRSLGTAARAGRTYRVETDSELKEVTPNGNAVVLGDDFMKVADTQANYQIATNLYKKHLALIRLALGGPFR